MKKSLLTALVLILTLTTAACGARELSSFDAGSEALSPGVGGNIVQSVEIESRGEADQTYAPAMAPVAENAITERMITRNANLTVVVIDPVQSVEDIGEMARSMDGFVVSSSFYVATFGESGQIETSAQYASITIRVPSDRLDEALAQIKADAVEVRNENVYSDDITQQFIDNESRLRNLEAAEEQLLEIMESATETEDVLNVFNELTRIRGEIEVIKGQLQYLQQSADTSSISIELIPDVATQPIEVERWQLQATFNKAVEALIATVQFFVRALIWIAIYVLPLALVLALVVWLVVRAIRKRTRADKGKPASK